MFFEHDINIPKNTSQESYHSELLRLTRGIIKRVDINFPSGCAGLVGVRLFKDSQQVIPSNYPKWIETDGETIPILSSIDLSQIPYELEFQAYNLDDTFNHTIRVRITMESITLPFRQQPAETESQRLIESLSL